MWTRPLRSKPLWPKLESNSAVCVAGERTASTPQPPSAVTGCSRAAEQKYRHSIVCGERPAPQRSTSQKGIWSNRIESRQRSLRFRRDFLQFSSDFPGLLGELRLRIIDRQLLERGKRLRNSREQFSGIPGRPRTSSTEQNIFTFSHMLQSHVFSEFRTTAETINEPIYCGVEQQRIIPSCRAVPQRAVSFVLRKKFSKF